MTSFDIAALVPELNKTLQNAYIENVYQIGQLTFLFRLHKSNQSPMQFLVEAGKRLHLTSYILKKPAKPPAFCMALRKYLRNGKISRINQHEFERIVIIVVTSCQGEYRLVCELFGHGNMILVSPENKILQALTYRQMKDRNVLRGEIFQHAPMLKRNPNTLHLQDTNEITLFGSLEIVKALTRFLGIGGLYSEEILIRAQIEKNTSCDSLTKSQISEVFEQLQQVLLPIKTGNLEPSVTIDNNGKLIDAVPIPMKKYADFEKREYATFNEAIDEYYTKAKAEEKTGEVTEKLGKVLATEQRILMGQQKNLEELKLRIQRSQKIGETIFSHLNELQTLLQRILEEKRGGRPWAQIMSSIETEKKEQSVPASYFSSLEPPHSVIVAVDGQVFSLDIQSSAQSNGSEYYTNTKKAKKKLIGVEQAIQETRNRIEEIKKRWTAVVNETSEPLQKKPTKAWYEKLRWFFSSEDFLVVGGRDATTNEILIKKHLEEHDIIFHAEIVGSPFVVIKTEGKKPSEQTLLEAAQFAASYSRAWKESLGAVEVYWIYPQQITKTPPSGQYLKRGSFIIQGTKHYIKNVPLRVAIGIMAKEEQLTVIGGPADAVSKHADAYINLIPGKQSSGKLAKQIRQFLAEKLPESLRRTVFEIPLDQVQWFIPSGEGEFLNEKMFKHRGISAQAKRVYI